MARRRQEEAVRAERQWARRAEFQGLPQPEVHPQAAPYRQQVAALWGRRAVDPYAVMERLPEGHPRVESRLPQPAESSLRLPPAAVRPEEQPAAQASVLRAQLPAAVGRVPQAGLFANPVQLGAQRLQALLAPWSALPWEQAPPDAPVAPPTMAEEAVCPDAQARPPGAAAVEPLAQQPGVAEAAGVPSAQQQGAAEAVPSVQQQEAAEEVVPSVQPREVAVSRASEEVQPQAAALQVAAAVEPRQAVAVLVGAVAAERPRAEDPSQAALPWLAAAWTCPQQVPPAPARSARFAPATACLRIAWP